MNNNLINKNNKIFFISNLKQGKRKYKSDGVSNKINGQIRSLKRLGFNVFYTFQDEKYYYFKNKKINNLFVKSNNIYFDRTILFFKILYYFKLYKPKYIYIRGLRITFSYFIFIFYAYINKSKVFIEIPTIESLGNKKKFKIESLKKEIGDFIDTIMIKRIKKFVHSYVNFQNYKKILGKRAIPISNGIDFSKIKIKNKRIDNDEVRLLAIALMLPTHGYERIIYGLHEYYSLNNKKKIVKLYLVGNGPETSFYKKLTNKLKLQKYILFFNNKYGKDLDELFNITDIGLGSFGIYKIGLDVTSILKIKEYCARGIPFVYGCYEKELKNIYNFCLQFPNDNTTINIDKIIDFYYKVYKDFSNIQEKMIDFANQFYTWEKQWMKIFNE